MNFDSVWETLEAHAREKLGMSKGWKLRYAQCLPRGNPKETTGYYIGGRVMWKNGEMSYLTITRDEHSAWVEGKRAGK